MPRINAINKAIRDGVLTQTKRYNSDEFWPDHYDGKVTLDQLVEMVKCTECKRVSVGTDHFGLVDIKKEKVIDTLTRESFVARFNRFNERYPGAVCSVTVTKNYRGGRVILFHGIQSPESDGYVRIMS